MALSKVNYTNYQTVVTAENMNDIQDEIISTTGYAVCNTVASVATKSVTLTNFVLSTGASVKVKFTYTNTAANPTMNINSTGAKAIMQHGAVPVGTTEDESWTAGDIVELVYDGTNFVIVGRSDDLADKVEGLMDSLTDAYSASATYKVGELCIYNNTLYRCTTAITTAEAWTAGHWTATTIADEIENRCLFFTGVTVSATTGTILSKSDSRITADHVVASCVWTNPSYITTDVTWTTAAGSLTMTGTCSTETTAAIILVKKNN